MGRSLRGRYSGVVRYTDELVRALACLGQDLTVYVTRAEDGLDGVAVRRVRASIPTPNEYVRAFWEQALVPFDVARLRPEVYHSPNYIVPLAIRCPTVVTVHDLAFFDRSSHRLRSRMYLGALTTIAVKRARRIICVSEFTRDGLVKRFPQVEERVRVVGEGVADSFRPQAAGVVDAFRTRHQLERPYVLFVGTIEPRKNLARLIRAFGAAVAESGVEHDLLIAGSRGWMDEEVALAHRESPIAGRIRLLGYVPDEDLAAAYSGADLFAYPSLSEGYGLPPLEAMACGTAVLTSSAGSLPEVVGNAAALVDPTDDAAMAQALSRLLLDRTERERLQAAGLAWSARFRWGRVAEETLAVYREAVA